MALAVMGAGLGAGTGLKTGTGLGAGTGLRAGTGLHLQRQKELPGACLSQPGQEPNSSPQGLGSGSGDTEGPGLETGPMGQDFGQKYLVPWEVVGYHRDTETLGVSRAHTVGTGCSQTNQGYVGWERGMGTGSKVFSKSALSLLCPPVLPWKSQWLS